MDVLKEYQHRRLDLSDMIRAAMNIARSRHDESTENRARSLLSRLAEDRFTLAVMGQFSRGKSTLMNAILGGPYLPTGVLPMTSVITTVRYGSKPRTTFLRRGSKMPIEVPIADVSALVAQSSELRAEMRVESVDIELPAELLRLGFAFVDTPGVGSAIGVNSAATTQFLPQADAVIFMTGFDSALTDAEVDFLREINRHTHELFCVINKRDLVDERTADEVAKFVHRTLDDLDFEGALVFELSALGGLQAKTGANSSLLASSGLPGLESALEEFLTVEKSRVLLHNVATRAGELFVEQRTDLQLGRLSIDGGPDPADVAVAFDAAMADLRAKQQTVVSKIHDRIVAALPARLRTRSAAWRADLREAMARDPEGAVREWLVRRSAEVTEILIGLAADQIGEICRTVGSPRAIGTRLAGISRDDSRADSSWSAADVPTVGIPLITWSVPSDQTDWTHFRAAARHAEKQRRLLEATDQAIVQAAEQVEDDYMTLSERWVQQLAAEAEKRLQAEATRFNDNLQTTPTSEDISAIDELIVRLNDYRADLDTWKPRTPVKPSLERVEPPASRPTETDCSVCVQLRETLVAYLSHTQFLLATREHDQAIHAGRHGFCPLHTWTYDAIASPLGISASYAALADAAAGALENTLTPSSDPGDLARAVNELIVRPDQCAACEALNEAEQRLIAEFSTTGQGAPRSRPLCAGHLAMACATLSSQEQIHTMVERLAATLRRNAEDMRSYALKREARFRSLITDEEAQAYRETLRLLAGEPALVRPWSRERDLEFPADQ